MERGFIHSCTDIGELDKKMEAGQVTAYLGFDATASSLHVGSLPSLPTSLSLILAVSSSLLPGGGSGARWHAAWQAPVVCPARAPMHVLVHDLRVVACLWWVLWKEQVAAADHDIAAPTAVWTQAHRPSGGGHHQGRRPVGQGRLAQDALQWSLPPLLWLSSAPLLPPPLHSSALLSALLRSSPWCVCSLADAFGQSAREGDCRTHAGGFAEDIASNIKGIQQAFDKFITFGIGHTDATLVNNDDWLSAVKYLEFLRDYGPMFTINRMLNFESLSPPIPSDRPSLRPC
jgi:hypothetical protein